MRAFGILLVSCLIFGGIAHADITSLVGDKDCFGLGGSCPDGSLFRDGLGGVFFTDYSTATDPPFTDVWDSFEGETVSFTHVYALPAAATSATLSIRIAGIHDIQTSTEYDVLFDGTKIGIIPSNLDPNAFQEVLTYVFTVPVAMLTGNDTVSFTDTNFDGYAVDYSELDIAARTSSVPEPSSLGALGALIGSFVLARRRNTRLRGSNPTTLR